MTDDFRTRVEQVLDEALDACLPSHVSSPHQLSAREREARDRVLALVEEAVKDRERYQYLRQFLTVDGDYTDEPPAGQHVQWLILDEDGLGKFALPGWAHTVEGIVDAAIASASRTQHEDAETQ